MRNLLTVLCLLGYSHARTFRHPKCVATNSTQLVAKFLPDEADGRTNYTTNFQNMTKCTLPTEKVLAKKYESLVSNALFSISLMCDSKQPNYCNGVNAALERVATSIIKSMNLTEPVNVMVHMQSFPDARLGRASPSAFYSARWRQNETSVAFPQSLIKQYVPDVELDIQDYDIVASFNLQAPFWFAGNGTAIQSNQYDFELYAARQFISAMGFWNNLKPIDGERPEFGVLPPKRIDPVKAEARDTEDDEASKNGTIARKQRLTTSSLMDISAFDAVLDILDMQNEDDDEEMSTPAFNPNATDTTGLPEVNVTTIEAPTSIKKERNDQHGHRRLSAPPGIVFLENAAVLNESYANTADFLMAGSITSFKGQKLSDLIAKHGGLLGPVTSNIMKAIGYPISDGSLTDVSLEPLLITPEYQLVEAEALKIADPSTPITSSAATIIPTLFLSSLFIYFC